MKILLHNRAKTFIKVLSSNGEEILVKNSNCTSVLWELAETFPEELIVWCEEKYKETLQLKEWNEIFHHDLIMATYAVERTFLPNQIEYIDQLPFVSVNRNVLFGTWRMSSDMGGIKGRVLLKFKTLVEEIKDFNYILNSIAKIGQQHGLLCYSAPRLTSLKPQNLTSTATSYQLFEFVYRHYKTIWSFVLFWCLTKYEKKIPFVSFIRLTGKKKFFTKRVDFTDVEVLKKRVLSTSIDVIIPTMGRPHYLTQFLKDLRDQELKPQKVIIIEQNPDPNSFSEIKELVDKTWPFDIVHHFIHQTGACNARNLGLKEVSSEWVFFADDDIRIGPDLLRNALEEISRFNISALNMNCLQEGEKVVFPHVKQWGSFGSGTSIVKSTFAKKSSFSSIYEHGYGEDIDFGMQLRNKGCDIIYHPEVKVLHLKAPIGGFRQKPILPWEAEEPSPKPSPTIMAFALNYFSDKQMKGYKISLFLKFYIKQPPKNPIFYLKEMNMRWKRSIYWSTKLGEKYLGE